MATVRRLGPDDWGVFREIRLRSLADSPDAFGSTLEREQGFTEDEWRQRLSGPVYAVTDPGPVAVGGLFEHDGVLDVNPTTRPARAAYGRYGFVATGHLEPLRPGSEQRMERMVLRRG